MGNVRISRSFKIKKGVLESVDEIAKRENRTPSNFVETSLAVVVAVLIENPGSRLTDLVDRDPAVIKTFQRLLSDT